MPESFASERNERPFAARAARSRSPKPLTLIMHPSHALRIVAAAPHRPQYTGLRGSRSGFAIDPGRILPHPLNQGGGDASVGCERREAAAQSHKRGGPPLQGLETWRTLV